MKKNIGYIFLPIIAIFAFVFCYQCGSRGFFPLDQSIVYDGAWRIIQGQVPFKDFIAPIGPISFLYQAEIFVIFGVNFSAYLIGASILNTLAAIITFLTIKIFTREKILLPLSGAIISSIWFYSQMGTTYPDQTAMFFCILSLFCLLYTNDDTNPKRSFLLLIASGFVWTMGFLSKQNYGGIFLPLLYIVPFFMKSESKTILEIIKKLGWITLGIFICSTIFIVWLLLYSDIEIFLKYFFQIPIEEGLNRFAGKSIPSKYKYNIAIIITCFIFAISAIYSIFLFFKNRKEFKENGKDEDGDGKEYFETTGNMIIGSVVVLYLICYSFIMIKTTNNNAENAWAFLGIISGIGFIQLFSLLNLKQKDLCKPFTVIAIILFAFICWSGIMSAWKREVHDFDDKMTYINFETPSTMRALKWCEQTIAGSIGGKGVLLKKSHIKNLLDYLKLRDSNFFIFPDFTALYGFTGRPSPQPLLWFHKGLTYPRKYDPQLDSLIVESLEKNNVDTIIFEEISWLRSDLIIKDFPLMERYINANFKKIGYIGFYRIYERKTVKIK